MDVAGASTRGDLNLYTAAPLLLASGIMSAGDVLDGIRLSDTSRRNRSVRVETGRGGHHLKQVEPTAHYAPLRAGLEREARLLETFSISPAFRHCRAHAPRFVAYDKEPGILVTGLVSPSTTMTRFHQNGGRAELASDVAFSAGRVLGRFHRAGRGLAEHDPAVIPEQVPLAHAMIASYRKDAKPSGAKWWRRAQTVSSRVGIDDLAMQAPPTTTPTLVHGDGRWDNFLLTSGGGHDRDLPVVLIDWELAHRGDPAYDVATWLSEYPRFFAQKAARPEDTSIRGAMEGQGVTDEDVRRSAQSFLDGYMAVRDLEGRGRAKLVYEACAQLPQLLLLAALETVPVLHEGSLETWVFDDLVGEAVRAFLGELSWVHALN